MDGVAIVTAVGSLLVSGTGLAVGYWQYRLKKIETAEKLKSDATAEEAKAEAAKALAELEKARAVIAADASTDQRRFQHDEVVSPRLMQRIETLETKHAECEERDKQKGLEIQLLKMEMKYVRGGFDTMNCALANSAIVPLASVSPAVVQNFAAPAEPKPEEPPKLITE